MTKSSLFKLFEQVGHFIRLGESPEQMLQKVVDAAGRHFELDRCVVMLLDRDSQELEVKSEFHSESVRPLETVRYQLRLSSEWYELLSEGRPVPLADISPQRVEATALPELDQFILESASKSLVSFPLVNSGELIGCLSMHYCRQENVFSEEVLEFGESLAHEVAQGVVQLRLLHERCLESRVFREAQLPMFVLDAATCKVLKANDVAYRLLCSGREVSDRVQFLDFLADSDGRRLSQAAELILSGQKAARLEALVIRTDEGQPLNCDLWLTSFYANLDSNILAVVLPSVSEAAESDQGEPQKASSKVEELVASLSKQLQWERMTRYITSSLTATFDRDVVLQTAVDSVARVLGVNHGLIVKTEGPAAPVVTHEFALPDISPLGLGRTSKFPASAVVCFRNKTAAFADLTKVSKSSELQAADLQQLAEGGVVSMAGAPVGHHGQYHGLIIVMQAEKPKLWTVQEMDLLEAVADQVAVALSHAQSYTQMKDQLFNMNLIGNLTQQLTNVLDQVTRAPKAEPPVEVGRTVSSSPPLSPRELEVLKLIASGLTNREIAQRLFLTESTVELHASRIRKKLKLKSRTALVKYACDNKLV